MIEALNSVVANSSVLRAVAGQANTPAVSNSPPPPPVSDEVRRAPQAPFISPHITIDLNFDKAVLQIRDSETGDVQQQFPSESRLAQIRQTQIRQDARQQRTESVDLSQASTPIPTTTQSAPAPQQQAVPIDTVVSVQQAISAAPANTQTIPSPQIAVAALSSGAQTAQSAPVSNVNVLA